MNEAPKKIWRVEQNGYASAPDVLYIRADLVDGLVEALEKGDYKPYCDCEECKKVNEMLKALEDPDV